jgi:hypothetical protein
MHAANSHGKGTKGLAEPVSFANEGGHWPDAQVGRKACDSYLGAAVRQDSARLNPFANNTFPKQEMRSRLEVIVM